MVSFAQQLHQPSAPEPGRLAHVRVTSGALIPFVQGTAFYTSAMTYDQSNSSALMISKLKNLIMCNFSARSTFTEEPHRQLHTCGFSTRLTILSED